MHGRRPFQGASFFWRGLAVCAVVGSLSLQAWAQMSGRTDAAPAQTLTQVNEPSGPILRTATGGLSIPGGLASPSPVAVLPDLIADHLERATVFVQASSDAGSGFVATERRILTSQHVVRKDTHVTVWFPSGITRTARVVASNAALDIAVLEVDGLPQGVAPLPIATDASPAPASPVWAWGYPLEHSATSAGFSRALSVSAGVISALRLRHGVFYLQTDAAVVAGNSGGPIVTVDGLVVGIASSVLTPDGRDPEGLNFAVDLAAHAEDVTRLLAR